MTELTFQKINGHFLAALDQETVNSVEAMAEGAVLAGNFVKKRNPKFLRKFFALLRVGFDLWEPHEIDTDWGCPEKSFKQFRGQVTVLAGYGEPVFNLNGTFRMVPRSISFANMSEEEFSELYSNVIDVILKNIPSNFEREDIERAAEEILGFS